MTTNSPSHKSFDPRQQAALLLAERGKAMSGLPEAVQARVAAILARSPAGWKADKVTPDQHPDTWHIELVDGGGQLMALLTITELPDK